MIAHVKRGPYDDPARMSGRMWRMVKPCRILCGASLIIQNNLLVINPNITNLINVERRMSSIFILLGINIQFLAIGTFKKN